MKWVRIDVGKGTVDVNDNITEGDLNSSGILVEGFPESWKGKIVNAVFYKGKESVDVILELNADKDRFTGTIPAQMLAEDGSFKVVIYAVSADQVDEPYKDVRPAVWAEVKDGLESAEVLPLGKDVGAYLTLLIDLQNKGASIDEMIAKLGDIEAIKTKLDSVADGAEANVQSDWLDEDETSDSYIKNKPKVDMELDIGSDNAIANWIVASNFDAMRYAFHSTTREVETVKGDLDEVKRKSENLNDALVLHKENGDEDVKHLTDSEKADVGKIAKIEADVGDVSQIQSTKTNIVEAYNELWDTVDSHGIVVQVQADVAGIVNGNILVGAADYALSDGNGRNIFDTYATKGEVYPTPSTMIPSTLRENATYNLGEQTELSLIFPTTANDGGVIYITFRSGATATNLTVDTTNTSDIDLIPEVNTGYEIYAKYNGSIWIVKYSEYTVTEVA